MKKQLGALTFAVLLGSVCSFSYAAGTNEPLPGSNPKGEGTAAMPEKMPPAVVEGEVIKMDRESYLVKDRSGKEIKIQLDQRTNVEGNLQVGDKVIAHMEPQGYAHSIKRTTGSAMDSVAGQPDKRTGPPAASDLPGQPSSGDVYTR
jgi:uncharacterized protein YdeI (BOF family)